MPLTTALPVGNSAEDSSVINIASGQVATVGIFSAAEEELPREVVFTVSCLTPGAPNILTILGGQNRQVCLSGPLSVRVSRPSYVGPSFGVFAHTA